MDCRIGCAACCIVISISSPLPGMSQGKPAGLRCIHLSQNNHCQLFGKSERPKVCSDYQADVDLCGHSNEYAFIQLTRLEKLSS